ncbi:O-antigen ligase family protein [Paenibacillus sp. UNC451MF]|uniref:O-antigen ligase family protein n=1 Tax=Paenibacillus sp. UNC451MF TaxID=1449063 RepID=UPI00048E5241|nr:O-antigen ligase family protein [Paenibacillus sp. UNC451MF]
MQTQTKYRSRGVGLKSGRSSEKSTVMHGVFFIFVTAYLLLVPYLKGLFLSARIEGDPRSNISYELPIQSTLLLASFILLIIAVYAVKYREQWKDHGITLGLVWLMPISAILSYIQAVSVHYAFLLIQVQLFYAIMFLLGMIITLNPSGRRLLPQLIVMSTYIVTLYGLLTLFGNAHYWSAVVVESYGLRLNSVFQYPNANAGFLLVVIACAAYGAVTEKSRTMSLLHAFMLVPAILSLFLTLSRGALLMLPIIVLLLMLLLKMSRQWMLLLHLLLAGLGTLSILTPMTETALSVQKNQAAASIWEGWGLLLAVALGAALIGWAAQHFLLLRDRNMEKQDTRETSIGTSRLWTRRWVLPSGMVVVGLLAFVIVAIDSPLLSLLPQTLEQRIKSINFEQHSVLERGVFYLDSLKIIKDYPVFGAGGGAWSSLYPTYQSYPYTSRQAHNFILQLWIEQGTVGLLSFIILLGYVVFRYIRALLRLNVKSEPHVMYFIVAGALLMHSLMDFDLSFVYLTSLVFLCLGGMAAVGGERLPATGDHAGTSKKLTWSLINMKPAIIYGVLLSVAAIFLMITGVLNVSGGRTMQNAVKAMYEQEEVDLQETTQWMQEAINKQPDNPGYMLLLINLWRSGFSQTKDERFDQEALKLEERLQKVEPWSRELVEEKWIRAIRKQDYESALTVTLDALNKFPWEPMLYERALSVHFQLSEKAQLAHDINAASMHRSEGIKLFNHFLDKRKQLDAMPKTINLGAPFTVTPEMAIAAGQMLYIEGHYNEAEAALKLGSNGRLEEQVQQVIARWYLAALAKSGKEDKELYDKLTQRNPEEKQFIEQLLHASY